MSLSAAGTRIVQETFFPNIRRHLQLPERGVRLEVPCFCYAEIDIHGIPAVDPSAPREPGRVLSCGHVVGRDCYRRWVREQLAAGGSVKVYCPTCKATTACLDCGRVLAEAVIPGSRQSAVPATAVPLTVPEMEGCAPVARCIYCLLRCRLEREEQALHARFEAQVPRLRRPPVLLYALDEESASEAPSSDADVPAGRFARLSITVTRTVKLKFSRAESEETCHAARCLARMLNEKMACRPPVYRPVWEAWDDMVGVEGK